MMVPVKHEGRVVGVVQVMTDAGTYSAEQLELVEGLVAQMAAAVRNARLHKDRRRLEVAEAAARAAAAEWEQAAQVLDAVGDGIFLLDPAGVVQTVEPGRRDRHRPARARGLLPAARRGRAARGRRWPRRSPSPSPTRAPAR